MGGFLEYDIKIFFSTKNITKNEREHTSIKIGKPVERLRQTNKMATIKGNLLTNKNSFGIFALI
jgi:hypothetical protein